jgi:hypothetical protein
MEAENYTEFIPAPMVQKKLGRPSLLGEFVLGWSWLGHRNDYAGIYQKRHNFKENRVLPVKERFYWPTNPQTPTQQSWRETFADGMQEWASLTPEERAWYNNRALLLNLHGVNLFMREYLLS